MRCIAKSYRHNWKSTKNVLRSFQCIYFFFSNYVFGTWGFFRPMHGKTAPSCRLHSQVGVRRASWTCTRNRGLYGEQDAVVQEFGPFAMRPWGLRPRGKDLYVSYSTLSYLVVIHTLCGMPPSCTCFCFSYWGP